MSCLPAQWHLTLCNPMDYSMSGSFVHGISKARIIDWVAISSSRRSSQPTDWIHVSWASCICRQILLLLSHQGSPTPPVDHNILKVPLRDLLDGIVVKNPSSNAGDMSLIPHTVGQLSQEVATIELMCSRAPALQQEKACVLQQRAHGPQQRPSTAKTIKNKSTS